MNKPGFGQNNLYENPFEWGTNEFNQQANPVGYGNQSSGNFIAPVADYTFAENSFSGNLFLQSTSQETGLTYKDPLAFGKDGKNYLTFNSPTEWFVKEQSLKALDSAAPVHEINNQVLLQPHFEPQLDLKIVEAQSQKEKKPVTNPLKIFNPIIKSGMKVIKAAKEIFNIFYGLIVEGIFGIGGENKRPPTKEEQAQKEKEAKRSANKSKFWNELASISKPIPIAGLLKEEMVVTNQMNGFEQEYKGVVTSQGSITEYHRSNRIKKEIENKAAQIRAERESKKVKSAPKQAGPFQMKAGEMLMGTENPSHFTKALG